LDQRTLKTVKRAVASLPCQRHDLHQTCPVRLGV